MKHIRLRADHYFALFTSHSPQGRRLASSRLKGSNHSVQHKTGRRLATKEKRWKRKTLRTRAEELKSAGAILLIEEIALLKNLTVRFSAAVMSGNFTEADRLGEMMKLPVAQRDWKVTKLLAKARKMLKACEVLEEQVAQEKAAIVAERMFGHKAAEKVRRGKRKAA